MSDSPRFRREHDSLGEVAVPAHALYGAQTQRAVDNFPISSLRFQRPFLRALGLIKACAAQTNATFDLIPRELSSRIVKAAHEVAAGVHDAQFAVDVFQTGSGTSTNMNANEVIARLSETHPNDDVNRSQSSNDVIPTAIHVAAAEVATGRLLPEMERLQRELGKKSGELWDVIKVGRTHLQDAVPIRLGQEFSGYARQVEMSVARVRAALDGIYELPIGGTAVGTGLNAPAGFGEAVTERLAAATGLPFRPAQNLFEAQAAKDAVAFFSGALNGYSIVLTKISNDIRWLASGPRCGIGEIRLPALQPGSSIMPGKVNPVIAESVLMVCAQVIGHDAAISWACASGNFELNTMMPLIAYDLLESLELLAAATGNFTDKCIAGLDADRERAHALLEQSFVLATALSPKIGYERTAAIVQEAWHTGRTVREIAVEKSGLAPAELDQILDPVRQTGA